MNKSLSLGYLRLKLMFELIFHICDQIILTILLKSFIMYSCIIPDMSAKPKKCNKKKGKSILSDMSDIVICKKNFFNFPKG